MHTRLKEPEQTQDARAAAPPATSMLVEALAPERVLALQRTSGNAAVTRMLARQLNHDQLAQTIHAAMQGFGTDEAAILNALQQLDRNPDDVDALKAAYRGRFGSELLADLESELSGKELQQAKFLLRLAPSPGMERVADELTSMVGQQATWTPSGPGSGNTFESWASASSEGTAPALSTVTRINCWEMVLLAAYRTGLLSWQWIHDQYTAHTADWFDHMVGMLSRGSRIRYRAGAPAGRKPLRGDIVFMDGMAHVALATGNVDGAGRAEVISFWPPPNTPFTRGGTIDSVKVTTIEELSDWWAANMPPAPVVELAAPPWS